MEILNFGGKEVSQKESLAAVAKDMEEKISSALVGEPEMPIEKYAGVVAAVLFAEFGSKRQELEPKYLVCESVAMAMASRALVDGHFGPFQERFLRDQIRTNMNIIGEEQ